MPCNIDLPCRFILTIFSNCAIIQWDEKENFILAYENSHPLIEAEFNELYPYSEVKIKMKKTKLLFVLIPSVVLLLLLILFLPIPAGTLEDGKSLDFQALTYRLVRWDRTLTYIDGSTEPYVKWSFYSPAYRDSTMLDLWIKAREKEPSESFFPATIIEIRENEFLVESDEGTLPPHRGRFLCKLQEDAKFSNGSQQIPRSDFGVGDMVYVAYTGEILETYPAQIPNVTRIVQISTAIP